MAELFVARHFWRNGEVAEWRVHPHFSSAVLAELRACIADLLYGDARYGAVQVAGEWVAFAIFDDRDVYGRAAPHFVAIWRQGLDRAMAEDIALRVCSMPEARNPSELDLKLPLDAPWLGGRRRLWSVVGAIMAGGIAATAWFLWGGTYLSSGPVPSTGQGEQHSRSEVAMTTHVHDVSHMPLAGRNETRREDSVSATKARRSVHDKLCKLIKSESRKYRGYCWFEYIRQRCSGGGMRFYDFIRIHQVDYSCPRGAHSLSDDEDFSVAPKHWRELVRRQGW